MRIFNQPAENIANIHFIGAGGIGMSGLMEALHSKGFKVTGSDAAADDNAHVARLRNLGVTIHQGHATEHQDNATIVVISSAIQDSNPELAAAKAAKRTIAHRADVLNEIAQNFNTIAVTGTHGKTSTTALIYSALAATGLDVGVINGGILNALQTNAKLPQNKEGWLVIEADESDATFTKFKPEIGVITNIEAEHMDTYGNEEKLLEGFQTFLGNIKDIAVLCDDDERLQILASMAPSDVVTYGLNDIADVHTAEAPTPQGRGMAFDAMLRGGRLDDIVVNAPGTHFAQNALAALAIAQILSLNLQDAAKGLENFQGVGRRFTYVGHFYGAEVIDDYGHHPTEIAATLDAAKKVYAEGKVVAVVQPHRYSRLRDLMEDFASSIKVADAVIVLPVYAAGESELEGINHLTLADKMRGHTQAPVMVAENDFALAEQLEPYGDDGNGILFLGAGSSGKMAKELTLR